MTAKRTDENQVLTAALEYAAMGWRVLPIRPRSKLPLIRAWQKNATADAAQIEKWFAQWPDANLGVALGEASGLIDIECDSDEAERELQALFHGEPVPKTATYRGQRGLHRLYRWQYTQGGAVLHVGQIEVRTGNGGKGAQSVFPPSIHPSGAQYQWIVPPSECGPTDIPTPMLAAIWNLAGDDFSLPLDGGGSTLTPAERAAHYAAAIEGCGEGERNLRGYKVACVLRRDFALEGADAWAILNDWNRRNTPPLPEAELRRLITAAEKYGLGVRGSKLEDATPRARKPKAWEPATPPTPPEAAAESDEFDFTPLEREPDLSAFCYSLIKNAKELARPHGIKEIFRAIEAVNLHREKPLLPDELKSIFTCHLKAERSKRATEEAEHVLNPTPEAVADGAAKRAKDDELPAKLWRLTIIESDPPRYELFSPLFLRVDFIILDAREMNNPGAIRVAALEQAECALPKAFDKLWSKPGGLYETLIHTAEHKPAPLEERRDLVVADCLLEKLRKAKPLDEGKDPRGRPCILEDGSVVFDFGDVWEELFQGPYRVEMGELSKLLKKLGATWRQWKRLPGRKFKCVSREAYQSLVAMIDDAKRAE